MTTERLHFHLSLSCIEEGNGNPLQCSCLENPRDGGAWWAAVYGVSQSRMRLKWLSSSSRHTLWCFDIWIHSEIMITISLEPSVPIQSYSTLLTIVLMLCSTQGYSSLQWKDVKPRCMRRNPKEPGCKIPKVVSQWSHTGCTESHLWCDNTCAALCTWDAPLSLGVQGFYWGSGSHVDTHALMAGHSYWRSRRKALVKPQIPSFKQTR